MRWTKTQPMRPGNYQVRSFGVDSSRDFDTPADPPLVEMTVDLVGRSDTFTVQVPADWAMEMENAKEATDEHGKVYGYVLPSVADVVPKLWVTITVDTERPEGEPTISGEFQR